jgi:hypothetical protein
MKLTFIFSESEYTEYSSPLQSIGCSMNYPSASSCVLLTFAKTINDSLADFSHVLQNLLALVFAIPIMVPVSGTTSKNLSLMKDLQKYSTEFNVIEDRAGSMILLWMVGDQKYEEKASECLKDLREKKMRSVEDVVVDKCFELDPFQLAACQQLGIVERVQKVVKPEQILLNAENQKIEVRIELEKWKLMTSFLQNVFSEIKESKHILSEYAKFKPFSENIRREMSEKQKLKVLLRFENNDMVLYAKDFEESEKVVNCMPEIFTEKTLSTAERMVSRGKLECAMKSWENLQSFVKITFSENAITVYGLTDYVDKVIHDLEAEIAKVTRVRESEQVDPATDKEESSEQGVRPVSKENFTARLVVQSGSEIPESTIRTKANGIARKHGCGAKFKMLKPIPTMEETALGCTWSFGQTNQMVIRMNMAKATSIANFNEVLVCWKTNESKGRNWKLFLF